jgi:hypothetical protein
VEAASAMLVTLAQNMGVSYGLLWDVTGEVPSLCFEGREEVRIKDSH